MRVAVGVVRLQADEPQQFLDARLRRLCPCAMSWISQRLGDDVADGHARIERGVRVLKDDLHLFAQAAQLVAAQVHDVAAVEDDLARWSAGSSRRTHAAGGRLARTGFADQAERLALRIVKSTPSTAFTSPTCARDTPGVIGKYL